MVWLNAFRHNVSIASPGNAGLRTGTSNASARTGEAVWLRTVNEKRSGCPV